MARQAKLIAAAVLAAWALAAPAWASHDPKAPRTPWAALSPDEQRILAPVANEWDHMPGYQQERLKSSARRYPSMQPIQKERYEQRIREWAGMTSEQRQAAREAYKGMRKLPPAKQHELRERWLQRHGQDGRQKPPQ